ncbi:MAG: hypothetical protein OXC93_16955, partial [Rhodospirillaceae bacterium]|nr:hypothetical protein [Rhodospirillaceae bacterium]
MNKKSGTEKLRISNAIALVPKTLSDAHLTNRALLAERATKSDMWKGQVTIKRQQTPFQQCPDGCIIAHLDAGAISFRWAENCVCPVPHG